MMKKNIKNFFITRIDLILFLIFFALLAIISEFFISDRHSILSTLVTILAFFAAYVIYRFFVSKPEETKHIVKDSIDIVQLNDFNYLDSLKHLQETLTALRNNSEVREKSNSRWVIFFFALSAIIPIVTWGIAATIYNVTEKYSNVWALVFSGATTGWITYSIGKAISIRGLELGRETQFLKDRLINLSKLSTLIASESLVGKEAVKASMIHILSLQEYMEQNKEISDDSHTKTVASLITSISKLSSK